MRIHKNAILRRIMTFFVRTLLLLEVEQKKNDDSNRFDYLFSSSGFNRGFPVGYLA